MPPAALTSSRPVRLRDPARRAARRARRAAQRGRGPVLPAPRFLAARVELDERRLAALAPDLDPRDVRAHLDALARIAAGDPAGGAVAALEPSERFGWLVGPVEHDHPALAGAHRAMRRPADDARPPVRRARRAGRVSARGRMIFVGECLTRTRAGAKVCAFPDAAGGPPRCPHAVRSAATVSRRRARARVAVVACPDRRSSWDSCSPCCSGRSSPHRPSRTRRR